MTIYGQSRPPASPSAAGLPSAHPPTIVYVFPAEPKFLVESELNPASMFLKVKIALLEAEDDFYPAYAELHPDDLKLLEEEIGPGTRVYTVEGRSYEIRARSTLEPGYIKFVVPLPEQQEEGHVSG